MELVRKWENSEGNVRRNMMINHFSKFSQKSIFDLEEEVETNGNLRHRCV